MKFSIKFLFAVILCVALLCAAYSYAPIATLSVVLLGSLPTAIVLAFLLRSRRRVFWTIIILLPLPIYLFYIGLLGPFTVAVSGPEKWGFIETRTSIYNFMSWGYTERMLTLPFRPFDPDCEMSGTKNVLKLIEYYQDGWLSWFAWEPDMATEPAG